MDKKVSSQPLESGGLFVGERSENAPLPWTHDNMVGYINDANGKHLINCARADLVRASGMAEFGDRVVAAVNAHEALVADAAQARKAIEALNICIAQDDEREAELRKTIGVLVAALKDAVSALKGNGYGVSDLEAVIAEAQP